MLWVNYSERKSNNILLQISYSRTKSLERKSYWRIVYPFMVAYSERNKILDLLHFMPFPQNAYKYHTKNNTSCRP